MKTFTIFMTASALMLGGCVTYQGGQTPDDVYYSPAQTPAPSYSNNRQSGNDNNYTDNGSYAVTENTADEGDYVTYQDGYDDYSYAARRYELFDQPNNFYNYNYLNSPYSFSSPLYSGYYSPSWGFSPYYNSWGMGYPLYSSFWYPSLSLGISYGYPLWGGHRYWGSPSYAYWNGYYDGYYGGYYGGSYRHGRYYDYNRPASTIAPRRSFTSSAITGRTTSPRGSGITPVRIMRTDNNNNGTANDPRRVLRTSDNERPVNTGRTSRRRIFRPAPDEQPANINTSRSRRVIRNNDNNNVQRRVSRPQPQQNIQRPQPQQRSFTPRSSSSSTSSSSSSRSSGSSAPVRSFRR